MRVRIASFAVLLAAVSVPNVARAVASAELYHTQPYVYGRFEARIRYAPADGVISSFFLWKEGSNFGGAFWNELDFEKLGAECHLQTNALYGNPVAGHEQVNSVPGGLCSSYHDYRFDWTPEGLASLLVLGGLGANRRQLLALLCSEALIVALLAGVCAIVLSTISTFPVRSCK